MSLTTPSPDVEGVHALDNSEHPKSRETECDRSQDSSASKQAKSPDISLTSNLKREPSKTAENHHGSTRTLPIEKVFPIQVGSEVFRLSGASISSDGKSFWLASDNGCTETITAPSYFSQFFEEQMREHGEETQIRTLYIDRDPLTFRDICRHLQGIDASSWIDSFLVLTVCRLSYQTSRWRPFCQIVCRCSVLQSLVTTYPLEE